MRTVSLSTPTVVVSSCLGMASSNHCDSDNDRNHSRKETDSVDVDFVLTGFGPFGGVAENPTSRLMERLRLDTGNTSLHVSTYVLETSVSAARCFLDSLSLSKTRGAVMLHLGVCVQEGVTGFRLEECAYNDASFRIPDETGYQPQGESVVRNCDFGDSIESNLDVVELAKSLQPVNEDFTVVLSRDPGRFVCNYTYCYSMNRFQSNAEKCYCLFLHVPPFSVVAEERQVRFVTDLLDAIRRML